MSQLNGKTIDGDGTPAAGVNGVTVGLELDGDGGGRVTEALIEGLINRTSSSMLETSGRRAGKDSSFEWLR
jgi:hypothetical protein